MPTYQIINSHIAYLDLCFVLQKMRMMTLITLIPLELWKHLTPYQCSHRTLVSTWAAAFWIPCRETEREETIPTSSSLDSMAAPSWDREVAVYAVNSLLLHSGSEFSILASNSIGIHSHTDFFFYEVSQSWILLLAVKEYLTIIFSSLYHISSISGCHSLYVLLIFQGEKRKQHYIALNSYDTELAKVYLDFSVCWYGKSWMDFLAIPYYYTKDQ